MNQSINLTAIAIADGLAVSLILTLLAAKRWGQEKDNLEGKLIRWALVTALFTCIADFVCFAFDGHTERGAFFAVYAGNFWVFFSNMIMGTLMLMIFISHISGNQLPRPQFVLMVILDIIGFMALIINFYYPIIFSVDANNVYSRGTVYWLFNAIEMIFTVDGLVSYYIGRRKNPDVRYFPTWQFLVPLLVGIVVQFFVYGISVICPALSIALTGIVLGFYNETEAEAKALRQHEIDTNIIMEQKVALAEALQSAEYANRAKTEFLFNMSHDIRTPMNAILGYTDIAISHEEDAERVHDSLVKIKTSGKHLLNLINDILEMSRIEAGKLELARNPMDIRDSINGVGHISKTFADSKGIRFGTVIGDIKNPYVQGDSLHVNEVLINLISNAIKYNREGGRVVFFAEQVGNVFDNTVRFRFSVTDNGIGMSEDFLDHIFEDFARENSSTVSQMEGSGLGLSIVKKIVDLAGGTISVTSKKNEGTKMVVEIPFDVMSEEEQKEFLESRKEQPRSQHREMLQGKRILLVEDNEMNREIVSVILNEAGIVVEAVEDGDIAVHVFEEKGENYYDFILMDIQMPIMNGYEATKAIRKCAGGNNVPIIALSANAFKEDMDKSIEAGMNAHVAKPIDVKELFGVLENLLIK